MTRSLLALALLPACAAEPPPYDPMLVTPSSQRPTADMIANASATSDGTATTIRVELRDRRDDSSIGLVDGDQLVARIGGSRLGMAEQLYEDLPLGATRARYELVLDVADPGKIDIELQRTDGTLALVSMPVPPAFDVAGSPPSDIKLYDHVEFSVDPAPGADQFGLATFTATALPPSNLFVDKFGTGSFVAGEAGGSLDDAITGKLDLALTVDGSYDPAFGNETGSHPRGIQVRSATVRLWP